MNNLKAERTLTAEEALSNADWLDEAARYFEKRPTGSEDMAFWANVANAERCRSIAKSLRSQSLSTQQPMGEVRMVYEAITNASDLLNVVILAGTAITQGDDGPVSSLTPLAMQANSVWCDLLSAGSILSALHPNQESGE